jgi:hypothetical protein
MQVNIENILYKIKYFSHSFAAEDMLESKNKKSASFSGSGFGRSHTPTPKKEYSEREK